MADVGPGGLHLVIKRIEVEIMRLEMSVATQELQLLEMIDQRRRIEENIGASKKALEKERENLRVTQAQYKGDKAYG